MFRERRQSSVEQSKVEYVARAYHESDHTVEGMVFCCGTVALLQLFGSLGFTVEILIFVWQVAMLSLSVRNLWACADSASPSTFFIRDLALVGTRLPRFSNE